MISGFHAVYEDDFYSAIDNANKHSFQFVQFDIAVPGFDPIYLSDGELIRLRDYAEDKNIELCFHAPADCISLFCDQKYVRGGIIEYYKNLIPKLEILNTRHITIHTGNYSKFRMSGTKDHTPDEFNRKHGRYFSDILYENIMNIISFKTNLLICFENCGWDGYIIKALERIFSSSNEINLTLDIPKAYRPGGTVNDEILDFMLKYINRVKEVHIHDWIKQFASHQTVGKGFVDFELFKDFYLKDDVYINYEVRPLSEAIISRMLFESKYC